VHVHDIPREAPNTHVTAFNLHRDVSAVGVLGVPHVLNAQVAASMAHQEVIHPHLVVPAILSDHASGLPTTSTSSIHCTPLENQGGAGGQTRAVSVPGALPVAEQQLITGHVLALC
jgi:hypothetical protein